MLNMFLMVVALMMRTVFIILGLILARMNLKRKDIDGSHLI